MLGLASGRLGRCRFLVSGQDSVCGVDTGDVGIFEGAYIVITDQIEARCLLAFQKGVSLEVEGRVPMVALGDVPSAEIALEVGIVRDRVEQARPVCLPGEGEDGVAVGEQRVPGLRPWSAQGCPSRGTCGRQSGS